MMSSKKYVDLVAQYLNSVADPKRAIDMKAYMRNQFEFLGIQTPVRRSLFKVLPKLPKDGRLVMKIAKDLWKKPEREFRYVACDLIVHNVSALCLADLPTLQNLSVTDAWWDTVDSLSGAIGDIVLMEKSKHSDSQVVMDEWLGHTNFWVRRSAMIHQLGWKGRTDTQRLKRYAFRLSKESEFFIRKSIAWAFRDYARHDPQFVHSFMAQYGSEFSNLTVREATKHL